MPRRVRFAADWKISSRARDRFHPARELFSDCSRHRVVWRRAAMQSGDGSFLGERMDMLGDGGNGHGRLRRGRNRLIPTRSHVRALTDLHQTPTLRDHPVQRFCTLGPIDFTGANHVSTTFRSLAGASGMAALGSQPLRTCACHRSDLVSGPHARRDGMCNAHARLHRRRAGSVCSSSDERDCTGRRLVGTLRRSGAL